MTNTPRIAIFCDFQEENWPSMDLVGDMLIDQLQHRHAGTISVTRICPPMRRRFARDPKTNGARFNADRFLNRFWDYPRVARRIKDEFDLFHVVDHSYGQLLHELPPERTIVSCHDTDTFQCLLHPEQERRSIFFTEMMKRTLSGFRQAALVTCDSEATRDELLTHRLIAPERAVVVANGVHPSCSPEADATADREATRLLGQLAGDVPEILHVGSTIPRKRIDLLLEIFAAVRNEFPAARLIRAGGVFTSEQARLVDRLDLARSIVVLPRLERDVLAAVYRRATVVLQPSEREGFGLPVVEALACGTPVIASDLPVLREVGGEAVQYCPVGNIASWREAVGALLSERRDHPEQWIERKQKGVTQAARFTWAEYAGKMVALYREILPERFGQSLW